MDFMQIFTLVTGGAYIVLEIRQKNFMWVVGIVTSLAAMWVFFRQGLYASFALNTYYLITSFIGLWHWKRDGSVLEAQTEKKDGSSDVIHLNRLSVKTLAVSAVVTVVGTFALASLMEVLENPMSYMDAAVAVLSAVATWWLVRSYLHQWTLFIIADTLSTLLCLSQQLWWMAALYLMYSLAAIYGLIYWKRNGRYII